MFLLSAFPIISSQVSKKYRNKRPGKFVQNKDSMYKGSKKRDIFLLNIQAIKFSLNSWSTSNSIFFFQKSHFSIKHRKFCLGTTPVSYQRLEKLRLMVKSLVLNICNEDELRTTEKNLYRAYISIYIKLLILSFKRISGMQNQGGNEARI